MMKGNAYAGENTIYLVTGAAGFLGSNVCRELIANGQKVRAFVLPNDKSRKFIPDGVEIVLGDLTDMDSLEKFFTIPEGMESVCLHIASIVTISPDYSQLVMDVNVGGTKNILRMVKDHPECRKLVYCSSTGAIPEQPKGVAIREVNHFDEKKVVGCYSQSKALATQAVLDAVKNEGIDATVVHPSGILGPYDYAVGTVTGTLIQIINGEMQGGIAGSFNLCDVRDLAHGLIMAATQGRKGECYILGNEVVTFKDFSNMIADEAGVKRVKMFLPVKLAYFLAKHAERKAKKTGKKPVLTSFAVYNLARNNTFDSSKAEEELDYHTRSYRETIHDMVCWMKEDGLIGVGDSAETSDTVSAHA